MTNAVTFHITVAGSNDADMLMLANYLQHNLKGAEADVATSTESVVGLLLKKQSSLLVIQEDPDLDLELEGVINGMGGLRERVKVIALMDSTTRNQVLGAEELGVDRVVDRSLPDYYDAVQSIVQESEAILTVEEKEQEAGLTTNAWIGLIAVIAIVILALFLLLQ